MLRVYGAFRRFGVKPARRRRHTRAGTGAIVKSVRPLHQAAVPSTHGVGSAPVGTDRGKGLCSPRASRAAEHVATASPIATLPRSPEVGTRCPVATLKAAL